LDRLPKGVFSGLRRRELAIIGGGHYLLAEVPSIEESECLRVWLDTFPDVELTTFLHDFLPKSHLEYFPRSYVESFTGLLEVLVRSRRVVAASQKVADEIRDFLMSRHDHRVYEVIILGFGSDASAWAPVAPPEPPVPMFVTVGGFSTRKNVELALQALRLLATNGCQVGLNVVAQSTSASASTRRLLRQVRKLGVPVKIHCRIPDGVVAGLLDQAPASLYLSRAEGYGLPVVESLSRGVPVIASATPTNRELARFGGVVLVEPDDAEALAEAMRSLITSCSFRTDLVSSIRRDAIPRGLKTWAWELLDILGSPQ
jgi:glycosyltransferase involved in cell wall biosynthesis